MAGIRKELQHELSKLAHEEAAIETELRQYFNDLSGGRSLHTNKSFGHDLNSNVRKIEHFSPCFEALIDNSKKLGMQVEDCRTLSDRLSILVRRLDTMQIRAQQALACTEDIINLKDSKLRISCAMENGDLPLAVSIIRQVHDIDVQAAKASDDFGSIQQAEIEVKDRVEKEFDHAIADSNIARVMSLCPLLQTLGLEVEARDKFIDFVEKNVFIAISADASAVEGATDPATGYAQALSNVFNSAYLILQQYLPMVIQGMENSLGDIFFIRRLHAKCELESGLVLKRYMKFRHIKSTFSTLKASSSLSLGKAQQVTPADIHAILDEIALLIQYCCLYSKYIKQLCDGAQSRKRSVSATATAASVVVGTVAGADTGNAAVVVSTATNSKVEVVFSSPTDFDKMTDELISRYYMEGEQWLMKHAVRIALTISVDSGSSTDDEGNSGLDECFFVLQRCGQRAVATNNIQAACAVLHVIADSLSSDLLQQVNDSLSIAVSKVASVIQEQLSRFTSQAASVETPDALSAVTISKGFKSALSLASSITAGAASISGGTVAATNNDDTDESSVGIVYQDDVSDPHGLAAALVVFNTAERCATYTGRLARDIAAAGDSVFGGSTPTQAVSRVNVANSLNSHGTKMVLSPDMEKLALCREDLDAAKLAFQQALRQGVEKLTQIAHGLMKDILFNILGKNGPLGGVKFDLADEKFDLQPSVNLLPKVLVLPFEILVGICITGLTDANKDIVVGSLADALSERLEHFISQSTFMFAGALKFEECVRALTGMLSRFSSSSIRGKFSRLREVMLVLTSDVYANGSAVVPISNILSDNFSLLTNSEIQAFAALRVDSQ